MVVDTSTVAAILFNEAKCDAFLRVTARAPSRQISAVSYMESAMVLIGRFGDTAETELETMLRDAAVFVTPVNFPHAQMAVAAFRQYGRGRHPAGLNFGDCFSYAVAKSTGEPLLFKGSDFSKTDINIA